MKIDAQVYVQDYKSDWDDIVKNSSNGTFLHLRDYIDYHQDRFQEHSLIFYFSGMPVGVLPIETSARKLYSYRGLTYAGWIFRRNLSKSIKKQMISYGLSYFTSQGFHSLEIRPCPSFLSEGEELDHVYEKLGGRKSQERIFHILPMPSSQFDRGKRWGRNKAKSYGLQIHESDDLEGFWKSILEPTLYTRHQAKPVHSLEEISLLKSRFEDQIRLFLVYWKGEAVAGSLFFVKGKVWHAQYTAASPRGRVCRALDLLFTELATNPKEEAQLLSLGTSIHQLTGLPDPSLVHWKESFGAKPIPVPVFSFDLFQKELSRYSD